MHQKGACHQISIIWIKERIVKTFKIIMVCSAVVSMLLLDGCASPGRDTIPPAGDMTMAQIYYKENGLSSPGDSSVSADQGTSDALKSFRQNAPGVNQSPSYKGQGADDLMSLNTQFKTLPNPQILVYVSPHLVTTGNGSQVPVPGYVTSFFMYPQNEFAMPYEHY